MKKLYIANSKGKIIRTYKIVDQCYVTIQGINIHVSQAAEVLTKPELAEPSFTYSIF